MQVADAFGIRRGIIYPCGAHEEGDQPPITCVEVKVGLVWNIEIGLLHNQWHTQHSLVEIDSRLAVGTNECDMVDTLSLEIASSRGRLRNAWAFSLSFSLITCQPSESAGSPLRAMSQRDK